jgi:acetyl-CoA acetyltransferase
MQNRGGSLRWGAKGCVGGASWCNRAARVFAEGWSASNAIIKFAPEELQGQGLIPLELEHGSWDMATVPVNIDEVIMGNVLQAGQGQNPARQAMITAGIPKETPAFTVNKICGSGLKAIGCMLELGIQIEKSNELGSGISIGHPVGCTGARQMVTGMYQMQRKGYGTGLVSLCIGGGMGMAMVVSR